MKSYIFITNEGFTFQPNSESQEPDIENCQVLGFGKGSNSQEALADMFISNEHLLKTNFDKIIALELKNTSEEYYSLSDYKFARTL